MTFSHWLKRFGAWTGRAALSCSLLLAGTALGADYGEFSRRLDRAQSEEQKLEIFKEILADKSIDAALSEDLKLLVAGESYSVTIRQAEDMIELRAFAQASIEEKPSGDPGEIARRIKENPLYRDPGDREESTWFAKGFESLGELLKRWLDALFNRDRDPSSSLNLGGGAGILAWLQYVFWGILIALAGAFIYFAAKHFSWKKGLERKAKALLTEDEPELTRDEYLAEADRLIAEGKHREAVRYLYLACLLLFDENGIARFIRGQTNWEHLRRIEESAKLPSGLDFRPATARFDEVWYGMRLRGQSDVDAMRDWYLLIAEQLRRKAA